MDIARALEVADFERAAEALMAPQYWAYLAGGAGNGGAVRANSDAFGQVSLVPRIATEDCSSPATSRRLFGRILTMPVLLAPTSPQRLFHEDAELACARAARAAGTLMVVSTDSHFGMDQIAAAAGGAWWLQLYAYQSREHVERLVRMAEQHGAEALVVTMDAHFAARRLGTERAGFVTPAFVDFGIMRSIGVEGKPGAGHARIARLPLTWKDVEWLRRLTRIPILLKGVLHPDDARRAVETGADGIVISNHGGRQLEAASGTLNALADIAPAVPGQFLLLLDGGVRCGSDVVKALALGARAVCIGRPYLWGLHLAGEQGVAAVLALLAAELRGTLQQLNLPGIDAIDASIVRPAYSPRFWSGYRSMEVHSYA
ncbi:alpha-hydroxy-acid oxidizing protein [Bradyrhizobium sp. ISRA443]|uniref:alpha-hydroxy acid oxidase n=1 Tax=unclassified Bradyrhizobium TaxID=2631580 RepID=UPI0024796CE2|nr:MULTISPECIES: alpha-hydroxy acid oxidase [unclassified Bradyrhizobium]WGR98050.1 alpha-hydroxy-acid oxidizing protein [Bradyrhizobium sp. ISRA436]WGS04939.1 alpha-hydroxy-acid oxidizing protein [Bradyrhizobium sp. ISRA437]WGS11823.1 alpha-hydroxy-acid oxidizing protein [Bradyrhizobium sp. ISRA443]